MFLWHYWVNNAHISLVEALPYLNSILTLFVLRDYVIVQFKNIMLKFQVINRVLFSIVFENNGKLTVFDDI